MFAEMKSKTPKKTDSFAGKLGGHKETDALFAEIKKGKKLMSKEERDKIEKKRLKENEGQAQGSNVQQPSNLDGAFSKMSAMISPPRSV